MILFRRLSAQEAKDVENVILDMRGRITRERITLRPSFKVGTAMNRNL